MGKEKPNTSIFSVDNVIKKIWNTSPHLILIAAAWMIYEVMDTRLEKDYVSTATYKAHVELITTKIKEVKDELEAHNKVSQKIVINNERQNTQLEILLRKAGLAP